MQDLPFTSIALKIWNCYITLGYGTPILSVQSMGVIEWNLYRGAIFPVLQMSNSNTLLRLTFSYPFLFLYLLIPRAHMCYHANLSILLCACHLVFKCICPWTKCDCIQEKQQAYQFCGSDLISFANNFYLFFKAKVSIAKHRTCYRFTKAHWAHFGRNKIVYFFAN